MSEAQHPQLVEVLLKPETYPDDVDSVELVETHISYLFLTGQYVYKVKKPVDYGFLDFTTLEQRRYYCHHEVELNRRLSPEIYLGVVEIKQNNGLFTIEGPGETVEYAVKMRQLPRDRAMTVLLQQGEVTEQDIQRLAAKIAAFHQQAATGPEITRLGDWDAVGQNIQENFQQTERFVGDCLSPEDFDDLQAYNRAFLDQKKELFQKRAIEGCIKDCHGDLHTAQIFLKNGISIIDCIEFNNRFRYSDVAEDIAFLAMDLDYHQSPDLSRLFVQTYIGESGDEGVLALMDFFKCYRAYVRGKVTSFRLDDASLSEEQRFEVLDTARSYFRLARSYSPAFSRPVLILVVGLSGTGKSTVAQELAQRWDLDHISSDLTRKELSGVAPDDHRYEEFSQGIYSPEVSHRTYDAMFGKAEEVLATGHSVILDATFRSAVERAHAIALGGQYGADVWIVECVLPDDIVKTRLDHRTAMGDAISDARWEIYQQQQREWEPIAEFPEARHIVLDTSGSPESNIRELLYCFYISLV